MHDANTYAFFAFISYKRGEQDEYYAKWLQKKLESYRIPTEIAHDQGEPLPKHLKVFRDKSDLGSHSNLQEGLTKSLGQSRYLIVVCSPRSAQSPYVDAEVRYFQEQGRGDDGEVWCGRTQEIEAQRAGALEALGGDPKRDALFARLVALKDVEQPGKDERADGEAQDKRALVHAMTS